MFKYSTIMTSLPQRHVSFSMATNIHTSLKETEIPQSLLLVQAEVIQSLSRLSISAK